MNTISLDLNKVNEDAQRILQAVEMLRNKPLSWDQSKWLAIPLTLRLEAMKIRLSEVSNEEMTQEEFVGGEIL